MYRVTSTAGLDAAVATIEELATELSQHLRQSTKPVHWHIVTPTGSEHHGYLHLNRPEEADFLAETLDEVAENLRSEARTTGTDEQVNTRPA